ncbi:MAG: MlaE family lipid ABC transporter permease subunit [Pseudomonadota bacterium]
MSTQAWVTFERKKNVLEVRAGGDWHTTGVEESYRKLEQHQLQGEATYIIDLSGIKSIDTTGSWILKAFIQRLEASNIAVSLTGVGETVQSILQQLDKLKFSIPKPPSQPSLYLKWLIVLGIAAIKGGINAFNMLSFLGQIVITLGRTICSPHRFRLISFVAMLEQVGLRAMPIVGLISFLLGIVIIYQGQYQLRRFGAEIFAVDLLAISMLREIGILITAIVIAGRSGSAFTAQIGTMKLNQEIDALQTFGVDPIEALVVPRLLALMIALPLLAFYANIMGLLGGALMANLVIEISYSQFWIQLKQAIKLWTFGVGMIKAPMFAFIIAMVGCFEGMQVAGGAKSIGTKTTKSVVEGIFLVIVFNAVFSIIFTLLGI